MCRCISVKVHVGLYECVMGFVYSCTLVLRSMCRCMCVECVGGMCTEVCVSVSA